MERFQLADQTEADAVRRAANAMWRYDRIIATETALFNLEFCYHECMIDGRIEVGLDQGQTALDPIHKLAVSFKEAAGDRAFDLCRRYLIAASREHDSAIRTFYFLESKRRKEAAAGASIVGDEPPAAAVRKPNEPTQKPPQPAPVTAIDAKSQPKPAASNTPEATEAQNPAKIA